MLKLLAEIIERNQHLKGCKYALQIPKDDENYCVMSPSIDEFLKEYAKIAFQSDDKVKEFHNGELH